MVRQAGKSSQLQVLREQAAGCRACDLWQRGSQTVFGEGPLSAAILFVGEQPGNDEDLAGKPSIGPAGKVFDAGLEAAGIDRSQAYVTNVVKHFKWEARSERRIHAKPNAVEVQARMPWLRSEVDLVAPGLLVLMGATAAQAVMGASFRITKERGKLLDCDLAPAVMATVHPSSILRAPDSAAREEAMQGFIADLRFAARLLNAA
jgi:uracil-DNA glycosylase family protein